MNSRSQIVPPFFIPLVVITKVVVVFTSNWNGWVTLNHRTNPSTLISYMNPQDKSEVFQYLREGTLFSRLWKVSYVMSVFQKIGDENVIKSYCLGTLLFVTSNVS